MTIKRKLSIGIMSAALGISLVGGGTWAAFNDIETVSNSFAAGTLDLSVNPTTVFDVKELAPGDHMTRRFDIINGGSIEIKEVIMSTTYVVKNKAGHVVTGDDAVDFASQFRLEFLDNDGLPVRYGTRGSSNNPGDLKGNTIHELTTVFPDITYAFRNNNGTGGGNSNNDTDRKLAVGDTDEIEIKILFMNREAKDNDGLYLQNKYQGWTLEPTFKLEAVQRDGQAR